MRPSAVSEGGSWITVVVEARFGTLLQQYHVPLHTAVLGKLCIDGKVRPVMRWGCYIRYSRLHLQLYTHAVTLHRPPRIARSPVEIVRALECNSLWRVWHGYTSMTKKRRVTHVADDLSVPRLAYPIFCPSYKHRICTCDLILYTQAS